jgi:hypothetical protein
MRTTDELVKIAAAGAGFVIEARRRSTDELAKIAAAAKRSGATVVFRNMTMRKMDALTKIAAAGKGHVIFDS